jgi:hypothetical protein
MGGEQRVKIRVNHCQKSKKCVKDLEVIKKNNIFAQICR